MIHPESSVNAYFVVRKVAQTKEKYNLKGMMCTCIVADGAAYVVNACNQFGVIFPNSNPIRCLAHLGSLAIKDGCNVDTVSDFIEFARDCRMFFHLSHIRYDYIYIFINVLYSTCLIIIMNA